MNPRTDTSRAPARPGPALLRLAAAGAIALLCAALLPSVVLAQGRVPAATGDAKRFSDGTELVQLDFRDVELAVVIEAIAKITGRNFIYDDRVRGRVTIVSPSEVTADQAYAVFESVLKVKGFTAIPGPGGVLKIVPVRDAKESSIETVRGDRPSPNRDQFVTRLVPLKYIDAEAITNTIKPLVSKDASMVAYAPTNTIILTDTEANIRRLLTIFEAIDIRSYKEELAVIKVKYADASTLSEQISEIYGAEVTGSSGAATAAQRRSSRRRTRTTTPDTSPSASPTTKVRIITDDRTNSLLVLAPASALDDIRGLVQQLDVPLQGFGRINVYYLKHADAEELATTLNSMLSGSSPSPTAARTGAVAGASANQALRSQVTELSEGVTITADAATNALVIQASKEAYETLVGVIEQLDIERPQVLVEALILEVDITDGVEFGFNMGYQVINGDSEFLVATGTAAAAGAASGSGAADATDVASSISGLFRDDSTLNAGGTWTNGTKDGKGSTLTAVINAAANDSNLNIVSAPHILTSDNEEAEIKVGNNIPIITGRTSNATGNVNGLSQAVNVERQDIGVTLRVTPQISEGDTLRLKIFQELTDVNEALSLGVGDPEEVGVALFNRKVENTVVVNDGGTVVIGGIISDRWTDSENKVPWLGDIPGLGWAFKRTSKQLTKINLLVFLTPHIIRSGEGMEYETIRKRREFELESGERYVTDPDVAARYDAEEESGRLSVGRAPARGALTEHAHAYPLSRLGEIEDERRKAEAAEAAAMEEAALEAHSAYGVRAGVYADEAEAVETLTHLVDAGYDGALVSGEVGGRMIYEIVVGPYGDLRAASDAAELLADVYGFETSVVITEVHGAPPVDGEAP